MISAFEFVLPDRGWRAIPEVAAGVERLVADLLKDRNVVAQLDQAPEAMLRYSATIQFNDRTVEDHDEHEFWVQVFSAVQARRRARWN